MIGRRDPAGVDAFRDAVARHLGLWFDGERLAWLDGALRRRLEATGQGRDAYLAAFADEAVRRREIAALAPDLTVGETYFFRYPAQFRALAEVVLPERMAVHAGDQRLRLLSAGCASGEEAYSIAITARAVVPPGWDLSILGVDLNAANVAAAERARYSSWALRETPDGVRRRWFTGHGRDQQLVAAARDGVRFQAANLVDDDPLVWAAGTYDAIFLRNVLIYFTPAQMRALIARAARALQPGGFLFLGHAETLRQLSTAFELRHTHDAFYYRRCESGAGAGRAGWGRWDADADAGADAASEPAGSPLPAMTPPAPDWLDAIARASARLAVLGGPAPETPAHGEPPPQPDGSLLDATVSAGSATAGAGEIGIDAAAAGALLADERYAELDARLARLPAGARPDPALLLVAAAAATHRGRLVEAEAACARLLGADPLNADAHGLLALCRDAAGDAAAAEQHDEAALYLEPDRPMPHVHLGLLARRRGDGARARRFFERALALLPAADDDRLRLAGAGLGRDALMALCRSELDRLGRPA